MNKTYTEHSTFKRYTSIINVLKSWGPLERKEVETWIKNKMDLDEKENIEKALRRDLKNLVTESEVDEFAFNKQGIFLGKTMEEEFSESVRFYKYQISGKDNLSVSGRNEIVDGGADLFYSPGMEHFLRVKKGESHPEFNRFVIYFELFNELYHLEIDLKTLTLARAGEWVNVIIAGNRQVKEKDMMKYCEEYGPYAVVLLLNDPFLSSPTKDLPGHLRLSFQQKGRVIIEDFGSKNGTSYSSLDEWSCNQLLSDMTFNHDKTKTRYWAEIENQKMNTIKPKAPELIESERILVKAKNAGLIFQS
jgi:hypothetical protein